MKRCLMTFVLTCASAIAVGQVSFQFVPEVQGRTADGLLWVKMNSLFQQSNLVQMEISVSERKAGKIITISTGSFQLVPGANVIDRQAAAEAIVRFADNGPARMVRQSSAFPEGEYEYCFQLFRADKAANKELLGEQCFDYVVEPLTPLFLIEPFDKEQTCDTRPTFTWQPAMPALPGAQYRVTLVEKKANQASQEALVYNLPVFNQSNVTAPLLIYPASARALEEGKTYTWQVTVYKEAVVLNRSEIWDFTVKCTDTPKVQKADGFRDIEDLAKGNYYIAHGSVHFSLYNAYEEQPISYTLFCINNPTQTFKRLPKVKVARGNNNISIDLSDNKAMVDGFHYVLTVKMPNGAARQLRFTYKSPV